jgi:hypothetical protein
VYGVDPCSVCAASGGIVNEAGHALSPHRPSGRAAALALVGGALWSTALAGHVAVGWFRDPWQASVLAGLVEALGAIAVAGSILSIGAGAASRLVARDRAEARLGTAIVAVHIVALLVGGCGLPIVRFLRTLCFGD